MMEVELITESGGLVGRFDIPPFQIPPEVLIWGARVFKWVGDGTVYREVFYCAIVTPNKVQAL